MASQTMNEVQKVVLMNAPKVAANEEGQQLDANGFIEEQQKKLNGLTLEDDDAKLTTTTDDDETTKSGDANGKGNEEKKIFCGGISYETSNEDLAMYFGQYGKVKEVQVKYDRLTGRSRGFAFVEFDTVVACQASLVHREQLIKGKQCEIKPAKSREVGYMNKKVFVGGLPGDFPEEELRTHFTQYGRVDEIEWPFDKLSRTRKNFAFVVFEDEESADRAAALPKQHFASRECDVKKAVPQSKQRNGGGGGVAAASFMRGNNIIMRNAFVGGGGMGGGGHHHANMGGMGAGGVVGVTRGGGGASHHHLNQQQQQQMPMYPNAASAAAYAHWYYNAAAAAAYGAGWYTAAPAAGSPASAAAVAAAALNGIAPYTAAPAAGSPASAAAVAAATPTAAAAWYNNGGGGGGQHHHQQQQHHHTQHHNQQQPYHHSNNNNNNSNMAALNFDFRHMVPTTTSC